MDIGALNSSEFDEAPGNASEHSNCVDSSPMVGRERYTFCRLAMPSGRRMFGKCFLGESGVKILHSNVSFGSLILSKDETCLGGVVTSVLPMPMVIAFILEISGSVGVDFGTSSTDGILRKRCPTGN